MGERERERGEGKREKQTVQGAGSPRRDGILQVRGHDLSPGQSLHQWSHAGVRLQKVVNNSCGAPGRHPP